MVVVKFNDWRIEFVYWESFFFFWFREVFKGEGDSYFYIWLVS